MPNCRRLFHSPIIKYSTILVRHVATDKRAFYLLNTTSQGPQIYELVAGSGSERTKWMKHITELATTSQKPLDQLGLEKNKNSAVRSESYREAPSSPRHTERRQAAPGLRGLTDRTQVLRRDSIFLKTLLEKFPLTPDLDHPPPVCLRRDCSEWRSSR